MVEPSAGLRHIFSEELEEVGFSTISAEWLEDAMPLALADPPDAIVLDATVEPASSAQLVRDLRSDVRLGSVPVVGIALLPGGEQLLLAAGAACCLRRLPEKGELPNAIDWAISVYGPGRP